MKRLAVLERRYRRFLACYPKAFRAEHEEEMLGVLMAGAGERQQRPRSSEIIDLVLHAARMRLRPRSQPTVTWAVRLMYVCAALRLLDVPILPTTRAGTSHPLDFGLSWGVFALLAWANGRGYNWARIFFAGWVPIQGLALIYDAAHISATTSTILASAVLLLIESSALALILNERSRSHYRHRA